MEPSFTDSCLAATGVQRRVKNSFISLDLFTFLYKSFQNYSIFLQLFLTCLQGLVVARAVDVQLSIFELFFDERPQLLD